MSDNNRGFFANLHQPTYTPHLNTNGFDAFMYRVKDNQESLSNTATVNVNINPINDDPVVTNISDSITINLEDTVNLTVTATDPENDPLTYTWDFNDGTPHIEDQTVNHIFSTTGVYNVTVTITDGQGGETRESITINVILAYVPFPTVTIDDITLSEDETEAIFTLSLSQPQEQPVTVNFSTEDGTAIAGEDYQSVSGTVTFNPNQTTQTISIPLITHLRGDLNRDGRVDNADMYQLLTRRNQAAQPKQLNTKTFLINLSNSDSANIIDPQGLATVNLIQSDPYDLDGDGRITVLDARILAILKSS